MDRLKIIFLWWIFITVTFFAVANGGGHYDEFGNLITKPLNDKKIKDQLKKQQKNKNKHGLIVQGYDGAGNPIYMQQPQQMSYGQQNLGFQQQIGNPFQPPTGYPAGGSNFPSIPGQVYQNPNSQLLAQHQMQTFPQAAVGTSYNHIQGAPVPLAAGASYSQMQGTGVPYNDPRQQIINPTTAHPPQSYLQSTPGAMLVAGGLSGMPVHSYSNTQIGMTPQYNQHQNPNAYMDNNMQMNPNMGNNMQMNPNNMGMPPTGMPPTGMPPTGMPVNAQNANAVANMASIPTNLSRLFKKGDMTALGPLMSGVSSATSLMHGDTTGGSKPHKKKNKL